MRLPVPIPPSPSPSPVRLPACALPFLLLPVADASRGPDTPGSQPYLQVGAAPSLRFTTAKPPAPVWHPPFVFTWPDLKTLAQEITARAAVPSAPSAVPPATSPVGAATPPAPPPPAPASPPGITILPDDTPRDVRSEEVLLYFQYPAAPAAGATPPSSATYRQQ